MEFSDLASPYAGSQQTEGNMKALSVSLMVTALFTVLIAPAQNRPKQEKLIFENEYVRAYEATLNPGESLKPHETGNRLVY
jgi:hypothetical protein